MDVLLQLLDQLPCFFISGDLVAYFFAGMDDRSVVPASKLTADLGKGERSKFPAEVHRDLPGIGDFSFSGFGAEVLDSYRKEVRHLFLYEAGGDLDVSVDVEDILECFLGKFVVDLLLGQIREGEDSGQGTLQFSDIGFDVLGNVLDDIVGYFPVFRLSLLAQDGDSCLVVRRLDIGDQAHLEPGTQPVLQGPYLLGSAVTGDDDLFVGSVEGIEGMEELFLGPFFFRNKLDVVDQKYVDISSILASELFVGIVLNRVDQLVGKGFGREVEDLGILVFGKDVVSDCMHQVGFAKSYSSIDKEGVIGLGRRVRNRDAGRMCKLIALSDDEAVEGIFRDEGNVVGEAFRTLFLRRVLFHLFHGSDELEFDRAVGLLVTDLLQGLQMSIYDSFVDEGAVSEQDKTVVFYY